LQSTAASRTIRNSIAAILNIGTKAVSQPICRPIVISGAGASSILEEEGLEAARRDMMGPELDQSLGLQRASQHHSRDLQANSAALVMLNVTDFNTPLTPGTPVVDNSAAVAFIDAAQSTFISKSEDFEKTFKIKAADEVPGGAVTFANVEITVFVLTRSPTPAPMLAPGQGGGGSSPGGGDSAAATAKEKETLGLNLGVIVAVVVLLLAGGVMYRRLSLRHASEKSGGGKVHPQSPSSWNSNSHSGTNGGWGWGKARVHDESFARRGGGGGGSKVAPFPHFLDDEEELL